MKVNIDVHPFKNASVFKQYLFPFLLDVHLSSIDGKHLYACKLKLYDKVKFLLCFYINK